MWYPRNYTYSQVVALYPPSTRGLIVRRNPQTKTILNIDVLNKSIPSLYYHAVCARLKQYELINTSYTANSYIAK